MKYNLNVHDNREFHYDRIEAQEREIKELKQYIDQLEKKIVYYKEKLKNGKDK